MTDTMMTTPDTVVAKPTAPILAADGTSLKEKLAKTTRRMKWQAFLLTVPLVLFLLVSFVLPIGQMLYRSIHNPTGSNVMPNFAVAIKDWNAEDGVPTDDIIEIFVKDMASARKNREVGKTIGNLATRVNYEIPGSRSLFTKTARRAGKITEGPYFDALVKIDKRWDNPHLWRTLQRVTRDYTLAFYLAATDRKYDEVGSIVPADELYQIYLPILWKTIWMSAVITLLCFVIAYPVSYLLSTLPLRTSNLLMILVLLPFWTSLLVRTSAWIAMLQKSGIINNVLVYLGIIAD